MIRKFRHAIPAGIAVLAVIAVVVVALLASKGQIAILSPAGTIAAQQRNLLVFATLLMLVVVIPVFALTIFIAWKYRATNTKARYEPEWDSNIKLEALWWGFPFAIIAVLAVLAWTTSHDLDPSRAIASDKKPLTIQVVALQWKWLFLYPEQQVASVNYVNFPAGRPVEFQITSDAPMNSFWIPRLGGQIYAMSGMTTRLNLMADQPGSFHGSSANISGKGFADMAFVAEASSQQDFDAWAKSTGSTANDLTLSSYTALSRPKAVDNPITYSGYEPGLYQSIIAKYNDPVTGGSRGALPPQTVQRLLDE